MNRTFNNPLFESLAVTAKKYERIHEDTDPAYKLKYANEYAAKILQLVYDQYIYFVSSIPLKSLKDDILKKSLEFIESKATGSNLTLQGLSEDIIKQWDSVSGSIMASQDLQKLSPEIKNIYLKVGEGMKASKSALDSYLKKYGNEASSQEVLQTVKSFIINSDKALKERKTK